jgi:uncharacterized membrane protein YphA (DoxX/SURF4 family)
MYDFLFTLGHVKWFTDVLPARPQPPGEVFDIPFLLAMLLSLMVMLVLTYYDVRLQALPWVERIHGFLDRFRPWVPWLIRIGAGVPLLAAGIQGYLLHYELTPIPVWVSYVQILTGVLILIPFLSKVGAVALLALYVTGAGLFGVHPMLDYVSWLGVVYYLLALRTRMQSASIAILYITTGLSLSWAAIEKWVYPQMAVDIIVDHGIPTFGFPAVLFLVLAGWVELSVGYLLITGVLNRFLALVVTVLFVMTSSLFGLTEVLGHWQLHTALLLFLVAGTGPLITPVRWHSGRPLQMAFVGVTLVPFVAVLIVLYYLLAPH